MNLVAGLFSIASSITLVAATSDDTARTFEAALNAAPLAKVTVSDNPRFQIQAPAIADLELMLHRGDPEASIEMVASQLMAAHPSASVEQTGTEFIEALEDRRKRKNADFTAKATAVLSDAKNAVIHAQTAADLDQVLRELNKIANPQMQTFAIDPDSQALTSQVNFALQFVSAWQDYLSASSTGKTEQAHSSLERILANPQLDGLDFFPRSKLLALRDGTPAPASVPTEDPVDRADKLLAEVKTVDDVGPTMTKLALIPNQPMNLTGIVTLEQAREDARAGLPVTLDLSADMTNNYNGDQISRITALELLAILPSYFNVGISDSPKGEETVDGYLDRLAATANTAGNLTLLQRIIAMKIAVTRGRVAEPGSSCTIFLAGLSQEAAGQYAPAVASYEKSLQQFDPLEPVKLVGDRLAAIKAAHPDDFNQGMTTFLTPAPPMDPRFPPGFARYPFPPNPVFALPIPMTVSIPARTATNAGPATVPSPAAH